MEFYLAKCIASTNGTETGIDTFLRDTRLVQGAVCILLALI